jgi:hypothetical protein
VKKHPGKHKNPGVPDAYFKSRGERHYDSPPLIV